MLEQHALARVVSALMVGALPAVSASGRELLFNGGCEEGLAGFAAHVNAVRDQAVRHSGTSSIRIDGTPERNSFIQQDVTVEAGRTYRFSVWFRSNAVPRGADAKAYYNVFRGDRLLGSFTPFPRISGTSKWQRNTAEIVMPNGADRCSLILQLYKNTGTVWFDDVSFEWLSTPAEHAALKSRIDDQRRSVESAMQRWKTATELCPGVRRLVDKQTKEWFIMCGRTAYTFAAPQDGFALTSLVDLPTRTEFILPGGDRHLFQIEFRPRAAYRYGSKFFLPKHARVRLDTEATPPKLVATFESVDGATATVSIAFCSDGATRWGFRAKAPPGFGIWLVDLPRIARLGMQEDEESDCLVIPSRQGQVIRQPRAKAAYSEGWSDYPGGGKTMQFEAYYSPRRGCGLYLATEDSRMFRKSSHYQGKGTWMTCWLRHYPPNMGTCAEFELPYNVTIRSFAGDWYDACQIYRQWALQQPWSALGPLDERADIPAWMKKTAVWCQGDMPGQTREDMEPQVQRVVRFARRMGAPTAFHAYIWQARNEHDRGYPILNPKPGFAAAVRDMQSHGVHVIPYFNVYSADVRGPAWQELDLAPLKSTTVSGDAYSDMKRLVPMCPAAPRWQEIIATQADRLMGLMPVDGLYLDQLTGAPFICFAADHGHPRGGGSHFADGIRALARSCREAVLKHRPNGIVFGENCDEISNDLVAAHLTWHEMNVGNLVPMFPAVYGDHVMRLGCFIGRPDTWGRADGFYSKLGLSFTWGEQLGWIMFGVLSNFEEPKLEPLRTFLASLAQTRSAALEFLAFGQMLKPLAMDNIPELPVDWNDWARTRHGRLPAVLSTTWRAPRGTVGIALCNWTGTERHILVSPKPAWALSGQLTYRVCRSGQWSTRNPLPAKGISIAAAARTGMVIEIAGVPGA